MNVTCPTCLELLNASDQLSCTPCGHVFHTKCLLDWLGAIGGKSNCPLCRSRCNAKQLTKIYFPEAAELSSTLADPICLQSRIDSLTFQVRCLESERQKMVDDREGAVAQAVGLREELRDMERRVASCKEESSSLRVQNRALQEERNKADRARRALNEANEKLELYQQIDQLVNSFSGEVNRKMHHMGDFSKTAKDLTYFNLILERKVEDLRKEANVYRKESSSKTLKVEQLKAEVSALTQANHKLSTKNKALLEDGKLQEVETSTLKKKMQALQEALLSPSGDPKSSAISRLVRESPAPALNLSMVEKENAESSIVSSKQGKKRPSSEVGDALTPVSFKTKQFGILGLNERSKHSLFKTKSEPPVVELPQRGDDDLQFDGLGGHSKLDVFPKPFNNCKINKVKMGALSKKPKGVSRPNRKPAVPASASSSTQPIDMFFASLND